MKPAYLIASTMFVAILYIYLLAIELVRGVRIDFKYHNYDALTAILRNVSRYHPDITHLYSIGKSVQGRELWTLLITKDPKTDVLLKPNFKYVGNMHGNEDALIEPRFLFYKAVGREMLLHLIAELINNYPHDEFVRFMLDNTRIHILPSMNPDGFEIATEGECFGGTGRYNARNYDLNRNFPDHFTANNQEIQPETQAIMEWVKKTPFVLSANLHGGALVASYPYDNLPSSMLSYLNPLASSKSSLTPDDDVFKHLASTYSFNHETMHNAEPCPSDHHSFVNGTTNGAAWYALSGGMQDYNYINAGCMEITLELSCCKYPPTNMLKTFWKQNRLALLSYMAEVHRGVYGLIVDINGNPVPKATLRIKGRSVSFKSTKKGEFWRVLLPGTYTVEVFADGYHPFEQRFNVIEGRKTRLDLTLVPITATFVSNLMFTTVKTTESESFAALTSVKSTSIQNESEPINEKYKSSNSVNTLTKLSLWMKAFFIIAARFLMK
ncbi:Csa-PI kinase-like protein [Dinothrombium tinctorium]|uniref:Csa-PI kinase-like protein n=2 Tax=Dinothrombium tinctorium TaxID=1965070 RepID=A0A3S3Q8B3_9ACAR|nr:Csa-PI kinase-like protein [Dinothrombium tinctorium]